MPDDGENKAIWKDDSHPAKPQISISEPILRWAMTRSGRGVDDLQRTLPKLTKWLKGEIRPTLHEVESLAKATSTPLGFFFLPEPPTERLSIPYFRTVKNLISDQLPSPDLIETTQLMERRQGWMREYLLEQGHKPLSFVRSAHVGDKPEHVASEMRQILVSKQLNYYT